MKALKPPKLRTPKAPKLTRVQRGVDAVTRFGNTGQALQRDLAVGVGTVTGPFFPLVVGVNELGYSATRGVTNAVRRGAGLKPVRRKGVGEVLGLDERQVKKLGAAAVKRLK